MSEIVILPVTPERWDDLVALFGTRGDPSWCWCQYFLTTGHTYQRSADRNRVELRSQVHFSTSPVGLIAYAAEPAPQGPPARARGGASVPVGWVQVGPRTRYPRITTNRSMAGVVGDLDDESVWAVTCFVVKVGWRRQGLSRALLQAAVELARDAGARALVGHPVDVSARGSRVGGSDLYHGAASTFAATGFHAVGRTGPSRPVMRLDLDLDRRPGGGAVGR